MRDQALNDKHARDPQPGDFWHEMLSPIARVLCTVRGLVIFQKMTGMGGKEFSDMDPPPTAMSKDDFNRWLRYDTMSGKTWCDVVPNRYPPDEQPR